MKKTLIILALTAIFFSCQHQLTDTDQKMILTLRNKIELVKKDRALAEYYLKTDTAHIMFSPKDHQEIKDEWMPSFEKKLKKYEADIELIKQGKYEY